MNPTMLYTKKWIITDYYFLKLIERLNRFLIRKSDEKYIKSFHSFVEHYKNTFLSYKCQKDKTIVVDIL